MHTCDQVVELVVFVHAGPQFSEPSAVADAASDLMVAVFGRRGQHARTALCVSQLPTGAAVAPGSRSKITRSGSRIALAVEFQVWISTMPSWRRRGQVGGAFEGDRRFVARPERRVRALQARHALGVLLEEHLPSRPSGARLMYAGRC